MNILQAVILGIVQGVAEFLPISSSGHLLLLQRLFAINEGSMTFDIVVHLGTLLAVVVVFWRDIASLVKKPFQKMTGLLIVGTIPAVIVGFLFKDAIESHFQNSILLAGAFVFTGILLLIADRLPAGKKTGDDMTVVDAVVVGCMQAVGIPPGVSRSGATITGALARGLNRMTAARFSFLLSIVAIVGAGTLQAFDIAKGEAAFDTADLVPYLFGFVASALSGYLAVRMLLKLIQACRLRYFSYYVFALAVFILFMRFVG